MYGRAKTHTGESRWREFSVFLVATLRILSMAFATKVSEQEKSRKKTGQSEKLKRSFSGESWSSADFKSLNWKRF
jgi:hypothetical protein